MCSFERLQQRTDHEGSKELDIRRRDKKGKARSKLEEARERTMKAVVGAKNTNRRPRPHPPQDVLPRLAALVLVHLSLPRSLAILHDSTLQERSIEAKNVFRQFTEHLPPLSGDSLSFTRNDENAPLEVVLVQEEGRGRGRAAGSRGAFGYI